MSQTRPKRNFISEGTNPKGTDVQWFQAEVTISDLAQTLIGMANSEGGIVLIGISAKSGLVQGVLDPDSMIDRIFQAALLADPPLVLPLPAIENLGGKKVIKILVPKGLPSVYNLDGRYLRRKGNQTLPLPPKELRRLLMERGVVRFETQVPTNARMDDLDQHLVSKYLAALNIRKTDSFEDVLKQRGCVKLDQGIFRPTYAGLLLFGRNPQQWLPSVSIMAARFPGETISDEFVKQEIHGTLPEQIRQAEVFVRDNLRSVVRLVGLTRKENPEYPLDAVRELLVNAVAHRDYNKQGDGIHLHIFLDRLEIHSPGGLPGPVNLSNLLEARFSRNAVIAQVLSDLGFVERLGYGLNRVVAVLQQNNLPAPIFKEIGGSFRVILKNLMSESINVVTQTDLSRFLNIGLNRRQESALGYLVKIGRITNRDFQDLCPGISTETLRRDLVDMVEKEILIKIGDKKGTYYILKDW